MLIPSRLQKEQFRHILLSARSKKPIELDWPTTKNYRFDDPVLQEHIEKGGNYGVATGFGDLLVVDVDGEEFLQRVCPHLPKTFTVKTGSGKTHRYFLCTNPVSFVVNSKGKRQADIQGKGKQVVGPGSTHPNGSKYEVLDDCDMAPLSIDFLKNLIERAFPDEVKTTQSHPKDEIVSKIKRKVTILSLAEKYGCKITGNKSLCLFHNEKNPSLTFYPPTNTFHCFGCEKNGDVFNFVKLVERCDFPAAKRKLAELAGIKMVIPPQQQKETTDDRNGNNGSNRMQLQAKTEHLLFFNELCSIAALEGKEYIPLLKGIYYHIISRIVASSIKKIKVGKKITDARIHALVVLPSGQGKKNIKSSILNILERLEYKGHVPTSLNPEQLIGKIINRGSIRKPVWIKNKGYFSRDFIIFDEMYNLLTSKEQQIIEVRKNLRIAKDPIGENRIEKKSVENTFDDEEILSYHPELVVCGFTQPKHLLVEIVEEGDLRRDLVLYVQGISERDKTKDYRNALKTEDTAQGCIRNFLNFCRDISQHLSGKNFVFEDQAVDKLIEMHKVLVDYGISFSQKGANFTKMVDFTLQDFLIKLSCIIAATRGISIITPTVVSLAFMDLTEFFTMQLDFIQSKIIGSLDYGEGWQGSNGKDQECLKWLQEKGAVSEAASRISIREFKEKICEIKNVKGDMAEKHFARLKQNGWLNSKQIFQDSKVWLAFTPTTAAQLPKRGNWQEVYQQTVDSLKTHCEALQPLHPLQPSEEPVYDSKSKSDLIHCVKSNSERNALLIEKTFDPELIQRAITEGTIFESPRGNFKVL